MKMQIDKNFYMIGLNSLQGGPFENFDRFQQMFEIVPKIGWTNFLKLVHPIFGAFSQNHAKILKWQLERKRGLYCKKALSKQRFSNSGPQMRLQNCN